MTDPNVGLPAAGDVVLAVGAGVTGLPVIAFLAERGCRVLVTSAGPVPAALGQIVGDVTFLGDPVELPAGLNLVVTSAGVPPRHPLIAGAVAASVPVIGEVELAWRLDHVGTSRDWLVVTGTNGKTTTTELLAAMLVSAGQNVKACGNVGWAVLAAVRAQPPQDRLAVELSSFQLHYAPGLRPRAGLVLNLAQDHLDWHGGMTQYARAKAVALTGEIAIAVVDDPGAAALLADSPAPRRVGITLGTPVDGQLGVVESGDGPVVLDLAFGHGRVFAVDAVPLPGNHNLGNAMAAAALAFVGGADPAAIERALREFVPGAHRNQLIAELDGVGYINDSKATNPHAAAASLLAYQRVVWLAGGQLKGAQVDELVTAVADRLAGVVLFGVDAPVIEAALARHAPDVPRILVRRTDDDAMDEAVRAARTLAAPGTKVLLAPAAASLDMFRSYAARGDAFAAAVRSAAAAEVHE